LNIKNYSTVPKWHPSDPETERYIELFISTIKPSCTQFDG